MRDNASNVRVIEIDLWKFIAALFVVILHSLSLFKAKVVLPYGYIACEFFFIVTGYLFAASVMRDDRPFSINTIGIETWRFIVRKIKGFWLYFAIGFMLCLIIMLLPPLKGDLRHILMMAIPEFLLLRSTGLPISNVMDADWYLSSMVIALFVLYPLFRLNKHFFITWIAPVLGIGCVSYMYGVFGNISSRVATCVVGNNIRAIGDICLGVFVYHLASILSSMRSQSSFCIWVRNACSTFCGVAGFAAIAVMHNSEEGVFVIIAFMAFVTLTFSGYSLLNPVLNAKIVSHLGKLSLSLYLTHTVIRRVLIYIGHFSPWMKAHFRNHSAESVGLVLFIYLSCSLLLAEFVILLCDKLKARHTPQLVK